MTYPVYFHVSDDTHAHGATVPDFPGCCLAAGHREGLPDKIQEAMSSIAKVARVEVERRYRGWK